MNDGKSLVEVVGVKKYFKVNNHQVLKAVDGVSFKLNEGETLGLVGESGCGKSTLARTILRLYEPTEGEVYFEDTNILDMPKLRMKDIRKKMQIIFQDPYASLNPRMTVEDIIGEPIDIHRLLTGTKRKERIRELLELVGLSSEHMGRFPHEFSGGQRQRIGIARALAVNPKFIVCDEPISALDVSIQAQVVNLMKDLQVKMGLTYLFIAHDLSMVRYISDRILVMYLGNMVELADSDTLYKEALHPYSRVLLSAIPIPDPDIEGNKKIVPVEGEVPSPIDPPEGCPFCGRCSEAMDICNEYKPEWKEIKKKHYVACHLYNNK